jgi:hypothetical protein
MNKTMMIFVSVLMISLMACTATDEVKQNWTLTITTISSISPAMEGYPITQTTTQELTNMSELEVKAGLTGYPTTQTTTSGSYTITITISATYAVKK